jgi:hypothetical protein
MTVMANDSSKRFHGSGSAGPFTWIWRFLANTDILVYRIEEPNEANPLMESKLLLGVGDYTLTGAGSYQGGTLALSEALAVGTDLLVERSTAVTQRTSIRNQGNNFQPAVHEDVFDNLTMMVQDIDRRLTTIEDNPFTINVVTTASNGSVINANAAAGPVDVDIIGLTDVVIIRDDSTANVMTILDSSGATIQRLVSITLDVQDDVIHLIKIGTNWKKI